MSASRHGRDKTPRAVRWNEGATVRRCSAAVRWSRAQDGRRWDPRTFVLDPRTFVLDLRTFVLDLRPPAQSPRRTVRSPVSL